jgi:hypothetical protein
MWNSHLSHLIPFLANDTFEPVEFLVLVRWAKASLDSSAFTWDLKRQLSGSD